MKTAQIKTANETNSENAVNTAAAFVQPKLSVGQPDDKYEKEADAVADKVMRMPEQNFMQRKCAHCEEEEKKQVQRKPFSQNITTNIQANGETGTSVSNSVANKVNSSKGSGNNMDGNTQSFMQNNLGTDFSKIKIHTDTEAIQMNQELNAKAFTVGNDIYFNEGQYQPASDSGKHLLAHELVHTIQQGGSNVKTIQRRVIDSHVTTTPAMLARLGLTRQEVIDTITAADADAIVLAQAAEDALTTQLANAQAGNPVDAGTELILNEELGLSFNNRAQHAVIGQQITRFRRVRETLESGFLSFIALGIGNIKLVGCEAGNCDDAFAFSCPGNRLITLCQAFWDEADEQAGTILHEPFHVWFHMARHAENALRRADASCFESFALRVSGRAAPATCDAHTAG